MPFHKQPPPSADDISLEIYRLYINRSMHPKSTTGTILWRHTESVKHPTIVRVQYFVRGGFVGHRSRVSSKHLSSPIFRSMVFDSSGVKKGLRCSCKMHVWVSGPTKTPTAVVVRRSDVTAQK
ncbi:hypothetical protein TNCV_2505001 [Trichonephila clavipes]|uniref:Uncharacterized protein n=1 Tax=Trichonephila clavipes TaxID=2585209 RepID=A0A8X6WGN3_TRICX|nr:hypothetical protein TNCV_2505001 [Trichonephila clavipes]